MRLFHHSEAETVRKEPYKANKIQHEHSLHMHNSAGL